MRKIRQNLENIDEDSTIRYFYRDSKSNSNTKFEFEFDFEDSNFDENLEYALKGSAEKAAAYKSARPKGKRRVKFRCRNLQKSAEYRRPPLLPTSTVAYHRRPSPITLAKIDDSISL